MSFLLDTNTVSYYFKGNPGVVAHLQATSPALIYLPAIVIYEIEYGISKSTHKERKAKQFSELLSACGIIDFGRREAAAAAEIRLQLEKSGVPIGLHDVLIGACAVAHGHVLVTHNTDEFRRVAGLRLADWFS